MGPPRFISRYRVGRFLTSGTRVGKLIPEKPGASAVDIGQEDGAALR